ncbi:ArsA family ATPase [Alcanivorax sp. JB21]|uniref:ArsA family ATPase n=1 Tax=Alcanivorax limicola TaxID=2874102 RepID=UPI001CBE464F|nr:ArsA family ATPase [Alcanivorax limicola]MBZ2189195.1 ArsA family ATPase [Alcanivorax limicola]
MPGTKTPALNVPALIRQHRLLLVGGKGGVGKTTMASALALAAAQQGQRVLLVSTDPAHSLADAFDRPIGGQETALAERLTALEIDPDRETDAYLNRVLEQMRGFTTPDQQRELARQMNLTRQSPGAEEAALLERLARLLEDARERFDLVVLDTAPTGHTLRLLSLPEIMAAWTDGLLRHNERAAQLGKVLGHLTPGRDLDSPMGSPQQDALASMDARTRGLTETLRQRQHLFHRTRRLLMDPAHTAFVFVMTPEKLPILETERAVSSLQAHQIPVAGIIINRVLPQDTGSAFMHARGQRQQRHLDDIDQRLGTLPRRQIALMADDVQGLAALSALGAELLGSAQSA